MVQSHYSNPWIGLNSQTLQLKIIQIKVKIQIENFYFNKIKIKRLYKMIIHNEK